MAACQTYDDRKAALADQTAVAEAAMVKALPVPKARTGTALLHDGIWVGGRAVLRPNGDPLPELALQPSAVVLNSFGTPLEPREIAAEIAAQTGLKVVLDEHLDSGGGRGAAGRGEGMALSWNGPLPGLLDSLASYFGLEWEYRGGQIRLFRFDVRTFTLAALPSTSLVRSGVGTTGGTASGGAGAAPGQASGGVSGSMLQDTANEAAIKVWDDVRDGVQALLPAGGKATMSPATGTLTVMAPPLAMRRIAAYVEAQNARITRQVTVSVKVLRVDVGDSYDLGLDLGAVFQQLSGQYAINWAGPAPLKVTSGTPASFLVQAIQNSRTGKGQWATGTTLGSTTHAVIDALQTMGRVSLMTETSVTTLNGQVAPLSVAEQQSYVASTATTLGGGTGSLEQTQITPATLVTGFNMQVLPRVLDDGQILLQYGLSLSDLKALTEFESNGTKVQLPDVNLRSFLQQAMMGDGDVLVLAGYQSIGQSADDSGLPEIGPSLLGGSVRTSRQRSILVILLTPDLQIPHTREVP
jgi:type IVB pilus formation R64 PilN family outer membrane protein